MFILLRERTKGQLPCELSQINVVTVSINLIMRFFINSGGGRRVELEMVNYTSYQILI